MIDEWTDLDPPVRRRILETSVSENHRYKKGVCCTDR
jgi:hypothetical protein